MEAVSPSGGGPGKGLIRQAMDKVLSVVREKVSADKSRYVDALYDLDLSYITDRVIAMAYPATGFEATYRNNLMEVAAMLQERHGSGAKVYNLCSERPCYPTEPFENRVVHWGFPDHNPPPLYLLMRICRSMWDWLSSSPSHVVVVHCLAGKGRTGVVVSAFLIYAGLFTSAQTALAFFAYRRSQNNWGCTNPSQVAAVRSFADIVNGKVVPHNNVKRLHRIVMTGLPSLDFYSHAPCFQVSVTGARMRSLHNSFDALGMLLPLANQQRVVTWDHLDIALRGDVTFSFLKESSKGGLRSFCYFSLHMGMLESGDHVVRMDKAMIDDAYKDTRFPQDFRVELYLVDGPSTSDHSSTYSGVDGGGGDHAASSDADMEAFRERRMTLSSHLSRGDVTLNDDFWRRDVSSTPYDGSLVFAPAAGPADTVLQQKILTARSLSKENLTLEGRGGYLTKLGSNVKNWKQRWFSLRSGQLAYFKSPRDATPAGAIQLADVQTVEVIENPPLAPTDVTFDAFLAPRLDSPIVSAAVHGLGVWIACESGSLHLWNSESCSLQMQSFGTRLVTQLLSSSRFGIFASFADGALQLYSCAYVSLTDVVMTIAPPHDAHILVMCLVPSPLNLDDPAESADPSLLCVARNNGSVTVYRPPSAEPIACAVLDDLPAAAAKNIRCMVSDGDSSVWIGTLNAVIVLDLKTLARRNVPLRGSASAAAVVAMCVADERCYCTTRDGLIHVLQMQTCAPLFVVSTGSITYSMTLVRGAHLWCGNAGGFTVYDITQPTAQPLKFLTPKAKDPFCAALDCGGKVWFASDCRLSLWKYRDAHHYVFHVVTAKRTLAISAANWNERQEWVESIEFARMGLLDAGN